MVMLTIEEKNRFLVYCRRYIMEVNSNRKFQSETKVINQDNKINPNFLSPIEIFTLV